MQEKLKNTDILNKKKWFQMRQMTNFSSKLRMAKFRIAKFRMAKFRSNFENFDQFPSKFR